MLVRLLGALLALLASSVAPHAQSMLATENHPSAVLGRPFPYVVYLPDGYQRGDLRYPVLYLLHGAGGDETAWVRDGGIKATADWLISSGQIPPAIIVMPGCRGCWWVDGAVDKVETAFWTELEPAIARRYRTIEGRRGRLVAGLSAGGYGAVRFAMRYPDRIAAAAALSPAVYAETPPRHSSARTQPAFLKPDGSFDEAAWKAKNYPAFFEQYCTKASRVAFYLVSGDNDGYGIAFETMTLFRRLYGHQPELTELRIVDGDHSWNIWARSIEPAMRYIFAHVEQPVAASAPQIAAPAPPTAAPIVTAKVPALATLGPSYP